MAKVIKLATTNRSTVEDAKTLVDRSFANLKAAYFDKVGSASISWDGDTAHVRVRALAQEVHAQVFVTSSAYQLEIQLPGLLASFAPLIEVMIAAQARETLLKPGTSDVQPGATSNQHPPV